MSATPEQTGQDAGRLGVRPGQVVQEFGYDADCDEPLRAELVRDSGAELADEDFGDVTDVVVAWWRADDGDTQDLADLLMDMLAQLEDGGLVWVLAPKAGRAGHVLPAEIEEAATTAGLHLTSTQPAAEAWSGFRLTTRGRGR